MSTAYRDVIVGWAVLVAVGLAVSASVLVASAGPLHRDAEVVPVGASAGVLQNRYLEASGEVLEPDPGIYDRDGLERWWRDYQLRNPKDE